MSVGELYDSLNSDPVRAQRDPKLRQHLVELNIVQLNDLTQRLKERAFDHLWNDTPKAEEIGDLLCWIAEETEEPIYRALGLRLKAQAFSFGAGRYQEALALYDQAQGIYHDLGDEVRAARINVTKVRSLRAVGDFKQIEELIEPTLEILTEDQQWKSLASFYTNLSFAFHQQGRYQTALEFLDTAQKLYQKLVPEGEKYLPNLELNRAITTFRIGKLADSLEIFTTALELSMEQGQQKVVAHVQRGLASIYSALGYHTKAMQLIEYARDTHREYQEGAEIASCDLKLTDFLLELGRFEEVVERCQSLLPQFEQAGSLHLNAECLRNQAIALAALGNTTAALECLREAAQIFQQLHHKQELTGIHVIEADISIGMGNYQDGLGVVHACIQNYEELGLPLELARAQLIAAKALEETGRYRQASIAASRVLRIAEHQDIPSLAFQAWFLRGNISNASGKQALAIQQYEQAILDLERIQANVMTEYRSDFLADKTTVYEQLVDLLLEAHPRKSFRYVERAKSSALKDLVRLPRVETAAGNDSLHQKLHKRIEELKARWQQEAHLQKGLSEVGNLLGIEKELTNLWYSLLIRDEATRLSQDAFQQGEATYALPEKTALIEFFVAGGKLVAFVLQQHHGGEKIQTYRLGVEMQSVEKHMASLLVNLRTVAILPSSSLAAAIQAAKVTLQALYNQLMEPVVDSLEGVDNLIVVPHGVLHNLPFAALFDGGQFLLERYTISHLPSGDLVNTLKPSALDVEGATVLGYSNLGKLTHAPDEAQRVSEMLGVSPHVEGNATREVIALHAQHARILHFATHAESRRDNPLFFRLALADGWLTALDIFSLKLKASLVTLSACDTGYSVIGGGDELQGLIRAVLASGASSVLPTLWAVADQSTGQLMQRFYGFLLQGESKASALRCAQLELLHSATDTAFSHPYFWAPFVLVGDRGPL